MKWPNYMPMIFFMLAFTSLLVWVGCKARPDSSQISDDPQGAHVDYPRPIIPDIQDTGPDLESQGTHLAPNEGKPEDLKSHFKAADAGLLITLGGLDRGLLSYCGASNATHLLNLDIDPDSIFGFRLNQALVLASQKSRSVYYELRISASYDDWVEAAKRLPGHEWAKVWLSDKKNFDWWETKVRKNEDFKYIHDRSYQTTLGFFTVGNYLHSDSDFVRVYELFDENRAQTLRIDLNDLPQVSKVSSGIRESGLKWSRLDLSNACISPYIERSKVVGMLESLATAASNEAVVIMSGQFFRKGFPGSSSTFGHRDEIVVSTLKAYTRPELLNDWYYFSRKLSVFLADVGYLWSYLVDVDDLASHTPRGNELPFRDFRSDYPKGPTEAQEIRFADPDTAIALDRSKLYVKAHMAALLDAPDISDQRIRSVSEHLGGRYVPPVYKSVTSGSQSWLAREVLKKHLTEDRLRRMVAENSFKEQQLSSLQRSSVIDLKVIEKDIESGRVKEEALRTLFQSICGPKETIEIGLRNSQLFVAADQFFLRDKFSAYYLRLRLEAGGWNDELRELAAKQVLSLNYDSDFYMRVLTEKAVREERVLSTIRGLDPNKQTPQILAAAAGYLAVFGERTDVKNLDTWYRSRRSDDPSREAIAASVSTIKGSYPTAWETLCDRFGRLVIGKN